MKRKFSNGTRVKGNDVKGSFRERPGTILGYEPGSGYLVRFDDGRDEYAYAHWLERA